MRSPLAAGLGSMHIAQHIQGTHAEQAAVVWRDPSVLEVVFHPEKKHVKKWKRKLSSEWL